jgi:hypothetical protein
MDLLQKEWDSRMRGEIGVNVGISLDDKITINVPLFKKLRDIIFFAGQSLYEPLQGTF